jgi:hypothetical protein
MIDLKLELNIKEIPNFPNYFVDIYGNIYRKKKGGQLRQLNPTLCDNYRIVRLYKDKQAIFKKVSVLVLETFVSPRPEGMVACHGVKGKLDDSLSNLSWGTYSKNNGEDKRRDNHVSCIKLTGEQVKEIRELYKLGNITYLELSKRFNISDTNIGNIITRKNWVWL